jgi:hypothetical protein
MRDCFALGWREKAFGMEVCDIGAELNPLSRRVAKVAGQELRATAVAPICKPATSPGNV